MGDAKHPTELPVDRSRSAEEEHAPIGDGERPVVDRSGSIDRRVHRRCTRTHRGLLPDAVGRARPVADDGVLRRDQVGARPPHQETLALPQLHWGILGTDARALGSERQVDGPLALPQPTIDLARVTASEPLLASVTAPLSDPIEESHGHTSGGG
ncbi:MAG TPA: hypothetical protein VM287_13565 [Egibacteraceae bacterium]|nr:hypothetical protein [Egibacteraceae bacterium]